MSAKRSPASFRRSIKHFSARRNLVTAFQIHYTIGRSAGGGRSTPRRIARLIVFGAVTLTMAAAFAMRYQRLQPVPYMSNYTTPCKQDATAAWCGSLQSIFSAGAILLGAGVVLLIAGVTLVALVHGADDAPTLAHSRWGELAGLAGVGAFWLSRQALEAYYNLSLFPDRYTPRFFPARLAAIDRMTQTSMAWSVGAIALAVAMLIFSLVVLWSARKLPPQTIAFPQRHNGWPDTRTHAPLGHFFRIAVPSSRSRSL